MQLLPIHFVCKPRNLFDGVLNLRTQCVMRVGHIVRLCLRHYRRATVVLRVDLGYGTPHLLDALAVFV